MSPVTDEERGPELISLRELARRLVADGVVERMSHQRLSKIARDDPAFPPVVKVGAAFAVDWHQAEPYFRGRVTRPGRRTDLEPPVSGES
jgi:hypothetical protein